MIKDATIFDGIDTKLLQRWKGYHTKNPHIYEEFKRLSFEMKRSRDKYSHWAIINIIRWNHDLKVGSKPFKISNDYIAIYGRFLVYHHPEFNSFFDFKKMKPCNRFLSPQETYEDDVQSQVKAHARDSYAREVADLFDGEIVE